MRIKFLLPVSALLLAVAAGAQTSPAPGMLPPPDGNNRVFRYHRGMGAWWKDSEIAKKLQLSDAQTAQLEDIFTQHRMKFIDLRAAMEKQDLKLQTLLDADNPDEAQITAQVDQVLAARGKLEREFTLMNLDFRRVLSVEQWRQLRALRGEGAMPGFFIRKLGPGAAVPLPPPPPGASGEPPM